MIRIKKEPGPEEPHQPQDPASKPDGEEQKTISPNVINRLKIAPSSGQNAHMKDLQAKLATAEEALTQHKHDHAQQLQQLLLRQEELQEQLSRAQDESAGREAELQKCKVQLRQAHESC